MQAQRVKWSVVLAEVRPRRPRRERDVNPVVHEHWHRERQHQRLGKLQQFPRRAIFPAHLHQRRSAGRRPPAHVYRISSLEQDRIGEHHQPPLIGERHDEDPARAPRCHHRDREHE